MPTNHGDGRTTAAKVPKEQPAGESPAATRELEFNSARKARAISGDTDPHGSVHGQNGPVGAKAVRK